MTLVQTACQEVVGVSSIGLVNRGVDRQMATPFYDFPEVCIACGSCAEICPTGAITVEDSGDTRTITMPHVTMEFKLKKCQNCGAYWAPERQLDYIIGQAEALPVQRLPPQRLMALAHRNHNAYPYFTTHSQVAVFSQVMYQSVMRCAQV